MFFQNNQWFGIYIHLRSAEEKLTENKNVNKDLLEKKILKKRESEFFFRNYPEKKQRLKLKLVFLKLSWL